jgi:energy-converting hydrogenase Eha subunit H
MVRSQPNVVKPKMTGIKIKKCILARGVKANKGVKQGLRVVQSLSQYHSTITPYAYFIHLSSTAMIV